MKEYEYAVAPTSQFYFCGVPFRLDLTPKCNLNCAYCFASSRGGRRTECDQIINTARFIERFEKSQQGGSRQNVVLELFSKRYALHLGGMSDPFASELSASAFDEIIKKLSQFEYPVIVSTKKPSELLKRNLFLEMRNTIIQVSLSITDIHLQKKLEPLADDCYSRLESIKRLISCGKNVSCRIQPIIPQLSSTIPALIDDLHAVGCQHIIFEYLKLPVEKDNIAFKSIQEAFQTDMLQYYKSHDAVLIGREWLLPTKYRYKHIIPLKEYANRKGIFVSIADYGLYHLGDIDCCCGIDLFKLDCTWNTGNFSKLIRTNEGVIFFKDLLDEWFPARSMTKYINSHSRLKVNTMINHLRNRWNKPGTANAPDSYYGVRYLGERDLNNDCVYINESKGVEYERDRF